MATYPTIGDINTREQALDPFRRIISQDTIREDIDLRNEFDRLRRERGHWIVFRKFDRETRSIYWDERTQSAVGGPEWAYTDTLVEVRKSRAHVIRESSVSKPVGLMDERVEIYYLPYDVSPTNIDLIIEIDPASGSRPTSYRIVQSKKIIRVDPMRDIVGRIEYYQVLVENNTPTGDATLR